MDAKEFRDMQVQTRGEFGGLGLEVSMENGVVKVVSPIADTPAARAGLKSGDLITALDKTQLRGLTLQEAVEKMRGPVHAPITLTMDANTGVVTAATINTRALNADIASIAGSIDADSAIYSN